MSIFLTTLNQIAYLFGFIIIGYILARRKTVPENSAAILSKLENTVFIPALILGTFAENFTTEKISVAWKLMAISFVISFITIPVSILISKVTSKDAYIRKIYTYALSFSNFAFMGNAIVMGLFPDIFLEYLIFTLPLWILIYIYGVPKLLLSDSGEKQTFAQSLKTLVNPMFIAMLIGMAIGISGITLPKWITSIINVSGDCMSPIAMLLTGMVISTISLKKTFTNLKIYVVSFLKLIAMPLAFMAVASFVKMSDTVYVCALCTFAMPFGLNTIVIPSAYGKDTSVAAGMAVISHLLSIITIPLIFAFMK